MKPDYTEFAKELLALCVKHGVSIRGEYGGKSYIIPSDSNSMIGKDYDIFSINDVPGTVELGTRFDKNHVKITPYER